jgi:hypothetical protein
MMDGHKMAGHMLKNAVFKVTFEDKANDADLIARETYV